eukprot:scaffold130081_cov74-Cyclotella_meneghiniana.AAC.1
MALSLMQSSKHFLPIVCSDIYILAYANEQQEVPHIASSCRGDGALGAALYVFAVIIVVVCCMMCPNCWCDGDMRRVDNLASDCDSDRGLGMRGDGSRGPWYLLPGGGRSAIGGGFFTREKLVVCGGGERRARIEENHPSPNIPQKFIKNRV